MVSVIIPVYNAEKTLRQCVDSILNQTYSEYELILIDDGSKDRSGQICDEIFKECRADGIRCQVIHQENCGVSAARNCGMDHANGEYFVCVDSDDLVEPCYLEDFVNTYKEHPEFGHIICGFRCTSHVRDYIYSEKEAVTIADRRDYMRLYDKILIQGPVFALYRTETVRNRGIRMREDLNRAEDILFNMEYLDALECTTIGIVNKPNYIYQNEEPDSLYRKFSEDLLAISETVDRKIKYYLNKWGVDDRDSWLKYYNTVFYNYQSVLKNTMHKQNPMTLREKIKYNNAVLKEKRFREALNECSVPMKPSLRRAYESGNYRRVIAVERFQTLKQEILKIVR